jgi:hypothetical protein
LRTLKLLTQIKRHSKESMAIVTKRTQMVFALVCVAMLVAGSNHAEAAQDGQFSPVLCQASPAPLATPTFVEKEDARKKWDGSSSRGRGKSPY